MTSFHCQLFHFQVSSSNFMIYFIFFYIIVNVSWTSCYLTFGNWSLPCLFLSPFRFYHLMFEFSFHSKNVLVFIDHIYDTFGSWYIYENMPFRMEKIFFKTLHMLPYVHLSNSNYSFSRIGIYKAYLFGTPTIMVTTPENCKQVLMDDEHFVPGWPKATNELIGKRSFLFIINEEHKRLRKLTSAPINGYDALSSYIEFIEDAVVSTLEKWTGMGEIEFLTEMRRLTFKIIVKIFLSSEGDGVMQSLEKVYTDLNLGMRAIAVNLPGFAFHRALKARKKLVAVLQGVLDERAARAKNPNPANKDMMDRLIEAEDENGNRLSNEEIIDILIMYLNAGHESSGHITMWTTVFLQEHPEIFQKAKAEQEEIRRNRPPTQKGLALKEYRKMEYLSKVIDETLRMVNISFVAFRQATDDVYVNGYLIPKGWKVQTWYRTVHMDPEVYPDPKDFNPSRWDDVTPKPGTFLPFGGGSRLCPGNDLAKLEISIFLHHFLLGYQ